MRIKIRKSLVVVLYILGFVMYYVYINLKYLRIEQWVLDVFIVEKNICMNICQILGGNLIIKLSVESGGKCDFYILYVGIQ